MKTIFVLILCMSLVGCGWLDRKVAAITGDATETCVDGVAYLQFTSGATVKYNTNGTIAICK